MSPQRKPKGILFQADMVRAIRAGAKTQTRRIAHIEQVGEIFAMDRGGKLSYGSMAGMLCLAPYQVGDVLYVKETFFENGPDVVFRADGEFSDHFPEDHADGKWSPSIFMSKKVAREWLRVTHVRCERVTAITAEDAKAEGCQPYPNAMKAKWSESDALRCSYMVLWESINGKGSWEADPYVFPYTFERIERPANV